MTNDTKTRGPTLYVVGTPIGNLADISNRALQVLSSVDTIVCEDTQKTQKLLSHFEIHKPTESFHQHSKDKKIDFVTKQLKEGNDLAYVTDAGTPTISDPGSRLVSRVREKTGEAIDIISIPGPSALTAALSVAGLPASDFLFLGFLPHKKGRQTLFTEIARSERTVVLYESPHRIMRTLSSLTQTLAKDRKVVIARELTKIHEEVVAGDAYDALQYFARNEDKQRGEFVVMIAGA